MVRKKAPCSPHLVFLYCSCRVPKEEKKRVGREQRRGKEKKRTRKGRDFYNNGRGPSFVNFFFHNSRAKPYFGFNSQRSFIGKASIKTPTSLAK
jgi:hypothetical protein